MQQRLRRQEEARRAFVATSSHELRTPVASLRTTLELAERDLSSAPPDLDNALDEVTRARRQAERLAALARDLLDLSRLDAGVALRNEPVDLGGIARAVAAEFADRGHDNGTTIVLDDVAGPTLAAADPDAVARIVRTLLENALLYSGRNGPIRLAAARDGSQVSLTVSDGGPGVPAAERELIFERFRRGTAALGVAGSGLGLAISRELARRMAGDLRAVDAAHGARFVLTVPASPVGA
jgi:signal transduction histidine kinase